jgi:hypothetical protein
MKKIILKIGVLAIMVIIILPATKVVADNSYTLLAPLPCVGGDCSTQATQTTLKDYIPGLFNLAIGLSAAFAVLMIVIGGFQYMSTDAIQGKANGKQRIKNAIYGLVLVIGAWLILYTINPALLTLNLNIETATTTAPAGTAGTLTSGNLLPGYALDATQVAQNQTLKDALWNSNTTNRISVNAGPCTSGGTSGCTNLVGLPTNAISGVEQLNKDCGCSIMITGGTEGGHQTHGPDKPVMDLSSSPALDAYMMRQSSPIGGIVRLSNGQTVTAVYEGQGAEGSSGPHWHITLH